jgi:hypothetical protein
VLGFGGVPITAATGAGCGDLLEATRRSHPPRRRSPPCALLKRLLASAIAVVMAVRVAGRPRRLCPPPSACDYPVPAPPAGARPWPSALPLPSSVRPRIPGISAARRCLPPTVYRPESRRLPQTAPPGTPSTEREGARQETRERGRGRGRRRHGEVRRVGRKRRRGLGRGGWFCFLIRFSPYTKGRLRERAGCQPLFVGPARIWPHLSSTQPEEL